MTSKLLLAFVTPGLLFQIACGGKEEDRARVSAQPVPVRTRAVQYEPVAAVIEAPGTVQPRNSISLAAQINGFVRQMRVREGDVVKSGQTLAVLDARDAESQKSAAQAAVEEAEAALSEARKAHHAAVEMRAAAQASAELAGQTLARYQKLAESRSVSPQELDEVRTRRNAANAELASRTALAEAAELRIRQVEAKLAQARAQAGRADVLLSWTEIKAPSAGRIARRLVDPGSAIYPGTPLLVLESTERPQVLADIPTEHSALLRTGAVVRLRRAAGETPVEGRIAEIIPRSDPSTHSIQFKVDLPSNVPLQSGTFVKVEVPAGTREAMVVPRTAVRQTGQLTGVFVVDSGSRAHFRLVKIAPYGAENFEILSGVKPGEKIISPLSHRIIEGVPVTEG